MGLLRACIFCALVTVSSGAVSERRAIASYLHPIVAKLQSTSGVIDYGWISAGNGGYLIRIRGDFNGDGRDEYLLTSSLLDQRSTNLWTVYEVNGQGELSRYTDNVSFFVDGAWTSPAQAGIFNEQAVSLETRNKDPDDGQNVPIANFTFEFPHVRQTTALLPRDEHEALMKRIRPGLLKTEAILLSDYLAGGDEWRVVDEWQQNVEDRLFRDEDWERTQSNTDFTPQKSLQAIDRLLDPDLSPRKNTEPRKTDGGDPGKPPGEKAWGLPILIMAILTCLLWGIFARMSKKRRAGYSRGFSPSAALTGIAGREPPVYLMAVENPYQPPQTEAPLAPTMHHQAGAEVRYAHRMAERVVKGIGSLYQLGGFAAMLVARGIAAGELGGGHGAPDPRMIGLYAVLAVLYLAVGTGLYYLHRWALYAAMVMVLPLFKFTLIGLLSGAAVLFALLQGKSRFVCSRKYRDIVATTHGVTGSDPRRRARTAVMLGLLVLVAIGVVTYVILAFGI